MIYDVIDKENIGKKFSPESFAKFLGEEDKIVEDILFKDCHFEGPISFVFVEKCGLIKCNMNKLGSVFTIETNSVIFAGGLIGLKNVDFENCTFNRLSLFVNEKTIPSFYKDGLIKDNHFHISQAEPPVLEKSKFPYDSTR